MHASAVLGKPLQRVPAGAVQARRRAQPPRGRQAPPRAFFNRGPPSPSPDNNGPASTNASAANSASTTQEAMVSDGAIKSLSPEARRIFREAQDNIIELNKSRLRALDELKAARQKIAELESKLESAVAEASSATAQLQQLGPASSQAAAAQAAASPEVLTYNFGQPAQQAYAPPQQAYAPPQQAYAPPAAAPPMQQQAAQQAPPQQAQQAPGVEDKVTVVYETGWSQSFLHYNVDGKGWTTAPGVKMDNGNQQFPDKKVLVVPGRRLEFVINDGGNDWDKPNPYGGGSGGSGGKALSNYVVEEPGVYRLRNGKVTRLA